MVNKTAVVLVLVVMASAVLAAIYQSETRKQYYQVPTRVQNFGTAVGMIVPRSSLVGTAITTTQTARSRFGVCAASTSSELYLDDISVGTCSGFLLTSGLLATAGTCVLDNNLVSQCNNLAVVFNFATTSPGFTRTTFGSSEVFYCQSVVTAFRPQTIVTVINATTGITRTDYLASPNYAVIQLDRSVGLFGINNYNYFRSLKNLHVNEKTYTIGHPLGLSRKYDDGGRIWAIDGGTTGRGIKIFTNSDTFVGSEGSPILDADGYVIAMHSSGITDFHKARASSCNTIIHCPRGIVPDDDDCYEGELGTSVCYFAPWNGNIENCTTAVGSKRNLPPGVNENIHRFNVTHSAGQASDYYGV